MKSIFDLPQSIGELPALNQGMSRLTYEQVPPLKNIQGTSFPGGRIEHRFEVSGNRWWIPSRSYIRLRANFTNGDGTPITISDDKAPNMGLMGNMFQSMEFKISQKVVSRISDRVAQVDALYNRLNYSKAQIDAWGQSTNWWDPDFKFRSNQISVDGLEVKDDSGYPLAVREAGATTETATEVGFNDGGLNTVQWTLATHLFTFAAGAGAVPNILNTQLLHVGDLYVPNANPAGTYLIEAINSATTMTATRINGAEPANVAARNLAAGDLFTRAASQANNKSPQRSNLEFIWRPPLSIFHCPYALPAGRYELSMIPQNSAEYMKKAIESLVEDIAQDSSLSGVDRDQIRFDVVDLNLYIATTEGPRVDDLTYMLDLEDINCQVENVTGGGFQQKNFDVEPSTTALTVAWQSQSAGLNTLFSQSKFKFPSLGANAADYPSGELALKRFFIRYGLDQKPSPDFDPNYQSNGVTASSISYITELYAETQLYSGQKFNEGSPESQQDWIDRGAYLYFAWPRDATDESTRVNVNFQFDTDITIVDTARLLLFNHYKNVAMITVKSGRVTDVVLQQG